jgi:hypothetical protein
MAIQSSRGYFSFTAAESTMEHGNCGELIYSLTHPLTQQQEARRRSCSCVSAQTGSLPAAGPAGGARSPPSPARAGCSAESPGPAHMAHMAHMTHHSKHMRSYTAQSYIHMYSYSIQSHQYLTSAVAGRLLVQALRRVLHQTHGHVTVREGQPLQQESPRVVDALCVTAPVLQPARKG